MTAHPRATKPPPPPGTPRRAGLDEAAALWWREETNEGTLRRDGRRWTLWTASIVLAFVLPGAALLYLSPLTVPVALGCFAHAWLIPGIQARRGARSVMPIGATANAGGGDPVKDDGRAAPMPERGDSPAERTALGLLGDLVGHDARELLQHAGLALERGELGVWLVGERGAMMVRRGGRRVDSWCVRVSEAEDLPGGDRVAHLLLALREDERGFATVANLGFSGATWRVRRWLPERSRAALDAARAVSRAAKSHP